MSGRDNNIFKGLSPNEAKKLYKRKAMELHPDRGGSEENFINLQRQYEEYCNGYNQTDKKETNGFALDPYEIFVYFAKQFPELTDNIVTDLARRKSLSKLVGFLGLDTTRVSVCENFIEKLYNETHMQ